jgi:uncharacterized cupredoxin-like copper-binding protein
MSRILRAVGALVVAAVVAVGCGRGGVDGSGAAGSVVEVAMIDVAFEPAEVTVPAGQEVTFRFRNEGALLHEAVIGTAEDQAAHAGGMASTGEHDGMDHGGSEDPTVQLGSGESGDLVHVFDEPGDYLIGCHVPGHYEAGMVMAVTVE